MGHVDSDAFWRSGTVFHFSSPLCSVLAVFLLRGRVVSFSSRVEVHFKVLLVTLSTYVRTSDTVSFF